MQLLETIKCLDGQLYNLPFHQSRFNLARKQFFLDAQPLLLAEITEVPEFAQTGLFRCRVLYSANIEKVEFLPHQYRSVKSLKLVEADNIDYAYKYENRQLLQVLYEQRGDADDILIVKNDCITDSFTANPVFFDGTHWWTPNTPLLPGTQRAHLLEKGQIKVCRITTADLTKYQKVGLINAMQDLENMPVVEINSILR